MAQTRTAFSNLRRRAEEMLRTQSIDPSEFSPQNVRKLVQELQVYQNELERQNEELQGAHRQLETSRNKYADLYEFAPVGYFTIDKTGTILETNLTGAKMLGLERGDLINQVLSRFVAKAEQNTFYLHQRALFNTHLPQTCEISLTRRDGTQFHAQLEGIAVENEGEGVSQARLVMSDITKRKEAEAALRKAHEDLESRVQHRTADLRKEIAERQRAEEALQASEERYKRLLHSVTDYIYAVKVEHGRAVATSHGPNCVAVTGYTSQEYEADALLWYQMVHEEDRQAVTEQAAKLLAGERTPPLEHRLIHKDGSIRWVRHTPVYRKNEEGLVVAYDGLITDITERRRLEERLTAIHGVGQELTRLRDEAAILARVLEAIINIFQCQAAGYGLVSEITGQTEHHYRLADQEPEPVEALQPAVEQSDHEAYRFHEDLPAAELGSSPGTEDKPLPLGWSNSLELTVPMKTGEQIIGVLTAVSLNQIDFTPDDRQLLQTLADQTTIAIENARLYQQIHRRAEAERTARRQADMLREATAALTSSIDLNEVLDSILIHLERVVPYNSACIFLWDGEYLHAVAGRGDLIQEVVGCRYSVEAALYQKSDPPGHPFNLTNMLLGLGSDDCVPGWLGVPLKVRGEVIGYLTLDSPDPATYNQAETALAQAFANQAAVTIQNAQLFREVRAGHEQLQSLSRRLVEVQESERHQIARELHDEVGQALTGLMVGLRLLAREANQPAAILDRVVELERTTDSVLENLHRLAMNLRPASLDHLGLVAALRQYIKTFGSQYGQPTQFEMIGFEDERLPASVETNIYRIVQEALTNVIRHAKATQVDVVLKRDGNQMLTIVEDNGIGFDPAAVAQNNRLGLLGMRERAEMLGGKLSIESTIGVGTTIFVEIPNVHSDTYR